MNLYEGTKKIISVCAGVKKGESVLVLVDPSTRDLAAEFFPVIEELGGIPFQIMMPQQTGGGQEPSAIVAAAMKQADVIIPVVTYSIAQTNARLQATNNGARLFNLPEPSLRDFTGPMLEMDFVKNAENVRRVAELIHDKDQYHVTTPAGTDLRFSGAGRPGRCLDGLAVKPGDFRSMGVEANMGPVEGTAEGTIVVDGSMPLTGKLDEPIWLKIEKGFITEIHGGRSAQKYKEYLESRGDPFLYNVAELGIGLNPKSELTETSYVEDESVLGTCHIGFGSNISQGGHTKASGHYDGILIHPTIVIDGETLMKDGEIVAFDLV